MENKISVRQISFIILAYSTVTKLIIYPSFMAHAAGNALIFPALFSAVLQTVVVWAVSFLSSRTDKTFFELLKDTVGVIAAKVIFFLFALFFIFNAVVPMVEQQLLVRDAFYDTIPALVTFLPFFFFAVYAGSKRFTNSGRVADLCLPIFAVALACIFIMSIAECRADNLLPVLKQPFGEVAGATLASISRFTEPAFLLMYLGHFKYKKGDCTKITLAYAVSGLLVVAFLAVFYCVYGELAQTRPIALTSMSLYFSAIDLVGRIDLIAIYALDIVMLFALVLNIQMSAYCLEKTFNWKNRAAYSLIICGVLLVITFICNNNFDYLQTVAGKWFWIVALIFADVVPLCAWALRRKSEKKAY